MRGALLAAGPTCVIFDSLPIGCNGYCVIVSGSPKSVARLRLREQSSRVTWMLEVLYEDNHLLAVNKPAMLPTMGVAADRPSLLTVAKEYIRHKYAKPGNVYLGIAHRLDRPVSGVVVFSRNSKCAARSRYTSRSGW